MRRVRHPAPPFLPPRGVLGYRVDADGLGVPFPVHVIGLDSAWLCGDDNDAQKLLLTSGQIALVAHGEDKPLTGFRLALVHHPLSWLADGDLSGRQLADAVDLLLHGHQHAAGVAEIVEPTLTDGKSGRSLRMLAAGSLYEPDGGDEYPDEFHVIDVLLTEDGAPLRYDIGFWQWKEGRWQKGSDLYETGDGTLQWWTPLGEAKRRQAQAAPAVRREVEPRPVFVGRDDELAALERGLLGVGAGGRAVVVCSLHGVAGVGKTWLVGHFCDCQREHFPGGMLRLVLTAYEQPTAEGLLGQLADAVDVPPGTGTLAVRVRHTVQDMRALVHLENVDSRPLASVADELAGLLAGVPLVVTGRYAGFADGPRWKTVPVPAFETEVAVEQLAEEIAPDTAARVREADRERLVRTLGGLPLAIHLAAGYLNAGYDVEAFLDVLREEGLSLEPFSVSDHDYAERAQRTLGAEGGHAVFKLAPGAAGERVELPLPKSVAGDARTELPVRIEVDGKWETHAVKLGITQLPGAPAGFKADGDLSEWPSTAPISLSGKRDVLPPDPNVGWNGPGDLSIRAWLAADEKTLYFAAEVTDDIHAAASANPDGFWNSDSIQIAIDPLNDGGQGFDADDTEIGLVLGPQGPRVLISYPAPRRQLEIPLGVRREGTKTLYEAAIPWTMRPGQVVGLDFIANDNDGQGRSYWMGLTPGIGEGKTPEAYRRFGVR